MTNLKVFPYVDRKTGKSRKNYSFEGKQCPVAILDGPIARRYAALSLIYEDLVEVKRWLGAAHELVPQREGKHEAGTHKYYLSPDESTMLRVRALWFAATVTYGKCFASSDARKVKLEREHVPPEFREAHEKVINYRNALVAHSGEHESAAAHLVLSPKSATDRYWLRADVLTVNFEDDRSDPVTFVTLVEAMIEEVKKKMSKIHDTVLAREVVPHGKEYWYRRAKLGHR